MGHERGAIIAVIALGWACEKTDFRATPPEALDAGAPEASTEAGWIEAGAVDAVGGDSGVIDAATCSDTDSDPLNCGRCGHSCLGGACVAGACRPAKLANGAADARAVAVTAQHVYWAEATSGDIKRVPIAGGTAELVVATGQAPAAIAVDGDRIFWTDQTRLGMHLLANPPSSFTSTTLPGSAFGLVVRSGTVYVATHDPGNTIESFDRNLASHIVIAGNQGDPLSIAVDATNAYWPSLNMDQIRYARLPNMSNTALVTNVFQPRSVALFGAAVYWTAGTAIGRAPIATGIATDLVIGEGNALSIAVDASGIYWMDAGRGLLRKLPLGGGPPVTLVSNVPQGSVHMNQAVALAPDAVYYVSSTNGTVNRLAK
jgi:hypothetical protein